MAKQIPAYLVASSFMAEGHGSLDPYGNAIHPLMEKYGGELLVGGDPKQFMDMYEGEWKEGARFTLFRFPSMDALQSFWNSEDYQKVKHLRTDVIPPNFTFGVEGFDMEAWEKEHSNA
ncbi:DUF1330 domain-containing protein [Pseudovibrio sp. Tun.PSC04-5.I4]|uniref:DUF1330 domain-containing protein n=1 Tax=Pseudovibrio sp. Tun.PSC04-5.I4 TaxID=1798213 RepID=UPI00088A9F33|nr:DUF1330 domain-containing protein [Pseudovibrio sp. Tun.PSC04-5.I4]SDQ24647.1 protein of unknown function [Pseudovibrio sp. Tun.PSC04-5.I4]